MEIKKSHQIPNAIKIAAIEEVERNIQNPGSNKSYDSASEMMKDILDSPEDNEIQEKE